MYSIIGLKTSGKLALHSTSESTPTGDELERACAEYNYAQILVIYNASQVARYVYGAAPRRLQQVPLSLVYED